MIRLMLPVPLEDYEWEGLQQIAHNIDDSPAEAVRMLIRDAIEGRHRVDPAKDAMEDLLALQAELMLALVQATADDATYAEMAQKLEAIKKRKSP